MHSRIKEPQERVRRSESTDQPRSAESAERLRSTESAEQPRGLDAKERLRSTESTEQARTSDSTEQQELKAALTALARPRLVGTAGAAVAARELRGRFEALGYEVREMPFRFSTWPGRFGVPLVGGVLLVSAFAATALLLTARAGTALAVLFVAAAIASGVAALGRTLVTRLSWGRVESANWLVQQPGARPRYLVVAHRDSKSQAVSIYVRAAAVVVAISTWGLLVVLAALSALVATWHWAPLTTAVGALAAAAGTVLLLCWASNQSPGALDNATGLAALLGLARHERDNHDVAFLVTDGEELGLAGAWAASRRLPKVAGVINLDGLDDHGSFHILEQYGWPPRGLAPHLAAALLSAAATLDMEVERRTLPMGVLVDHIAFAEDGLPAVTVARGTPESLRRVHRPEDTARHLSGAGVAATVALVAKALGLLRDGVVRRHG